MAEHADTMAEARVRTQELADRDGIQWGAISTDGDGYLLASEHSVWFTAGQKLGFVKYVARPGGEASGWPDLMVCVDGVEAQSYGMPRDTAAAIQRALAEKNAHPDALVTIVLVRSSTEGEKAQGVIQVGLGA